MLISLIIFSAKYLFVIIPLISVIYFLLQKKEIQKKMIILAALTFPLTFIVSRIASYCYYNPRPFALYNFEPLIPHAVDNGFPSDHALFSFAIAFLIFFFNKKFGIVLMILGFTVGSSRVLSGIHSPIDIIGSFVISSLVTFAVYSFYTKKRILSIN